MNSRVYDGCWWRSLTRAKAWAGLVALSLLILQIGGARSKAARESEAEAQWGEYIPLLDSFSEPAVAMAILKQHLQRLFFACTRDGDVGGGTDLSFKEVPQARPGAKRNDWKPLARLRFEADVNVGADPACQSLSEFRESARSLYRESLEDVMVMQFKHRSWNGFLDSYLELLALRPTQIDPVIWGPEALAASRICGRTNEVLDAMGRFIRFSKDEKMVARFQALVGDWAAGRLEDRIKYFEPSLNRGSLCPGAIPAAAPALARR